VNSDDSIREIIQAATDRRFEDVLKGLDRARESGAYTGKEPELCDAHIAALLASGKTDEAEAVLAKALDGVADKDAPVVLLADKAVIAFRQGHFEDVVQDMAQLRIAGAYTGREPQFCDLHVSALVALGKVGDAANILTDALSGVSAEDIPLALLIDQAVVALRQDRYKDALQSLDLAERSDLDRDTKIAERNLRVQALMGLGQQAKAAEVIKEVGVLMGGTGRWVRLELAALQGGQNTIDTLLAIAQETADAIPSKDDGPFDLLAIALARIAVAQTTDAAEPLRQAKERDPQISANPDYLLAELSVEVNAGDFDAARATASRIKAAAPIYGPGSDVVLGGGLASSGQDDEARQRLHLALESPDESGPLAVLLLDVKVVAAALLALLELEHDRRAAAVAVGQANELVARIPVAPQSKVIYGQLEFVQGILDREEGNLDAAIENLGKAARSADAMPQLVRARIWGVYADTLVKASRNDEALAWYDHAIALNGDQVNQENARAFLGRGQAYRNVEDFEASLSDYQHAIKIAAAVKDDRVLAAAWEGEAEAYIAMGAADRAVDCSRQLLGLRPQRDSTWQLLGYSYDQTGRYMAAARAYRRGWDVSSPKNVDLALAASASMMAAGSPQEAVTFLDGVKTALRAAKKPDPRLDYQRAAALHQLNLPDEAARALSAAAAAGYKPAAAQLARRIPKGGPWVEYWFSPLQSRSRRFIGTILAAAIVVALVLAIANPHSVVWTRWLNPSSDWARLAPALVLLALFLIPSVSLKVGPSGVEIEPISPSPEPSAVALDEDLKPIVITLATLSLQTLQTHIAASGPLRQAAASS
jgi:tetratricopeptide (TPR) repeat protein